MPRWPIPPPIHLGPPQPFAAVPVGTIVAFAGQVESQTSTGSLELARTGWLLCDGSELRIAEYPELHAVLGDLYSPTPSPPDGYFHLPDLGGQFLRGVTDDTSLDPDLDERKLANGSSGTGTKADQYVGTFQSYALQDHTHSYNAADVATVNSQSSTLAATAPMTKDTEGAQAMTGTELGLSQHETRPRNAAVYYIIKYTNFASPLVGLPTRAPWPGGIP